MRAGYLLLALMLIAHRAAAQVAPPESIATGKQLFAARCSVGYCHGAEGRAGRGPRLRDREWDRNYLYKVIDEGIPNSSMPAWRGKLPNGQMLSIVDYILSISKEVVHTDRGAPVRDEAAASPRVATPASSRDGGIMGNPATGRALFFDATNDRNCGVCHKMAGAGGDAGPDLSKIAALPAREILRRILFSAVMPERKPTLDLVTRDGETVRGILVDESASRLRLYDLTSPGPPVLRTFSPPDIAQRRAATGDFVHENFAGAYTLRQLLDIVTYLKSARVTLGDLWGGP
jgi:putative heme-binding domain-containing protein